MKSSDPSDQVIPPTPGDNAACEILCDPLLHLIPRHAIAEEVRGKGDDFCWHLDRWL